MSAREARVERHHLVTVDRATGQLIRVEDVDVVTRDDWNGRIAMLHDDDGPVTS